MIMKEKTNQKNERYQVESCRNIKTIEIPEGAAVDKRVAEEELLSEPFSDGKPEEINHNGKTFKRLRSRSQLRLGREAIFVNVDNNGYLGQKNNSQDRWVNCERWDLRDDSIFQISSPIFEWIFGRDDLRFLHQLDENGYLDMLLTQNNPGKTMALNLEEIKNGKLNGKNINDYTLEEINDLAGHGSTSIDLKGLLAFLNERREFTYNDIAIFVPDNLQDEVREIFDEYDENLNNVEIWGHKILPALGVAIAVFLISASINLKDIEEQILTYADFFVTGFSLRHRKRGFEDHYKHTHKGGDPAFTRGKFMKYTEREAILNIDTDNGKVYMPMMFKLDNHKIGYDHLNIPAASINFSPNRNIVGNVINIIFGGLVSEGHLFKANSYNNLDIDITGKNETAPRDTFRIYIED